MNQKILICGGVAVAVALTALYVNRPASAARDQRTDDAYLTADYTNVAPLVNGIITRLVVRENQHVTKGDLLAVIDDRDLKIAVENTQAAFATAQANLKTLLATVPAQNAAVEQAVSALTSARSNETFTQIDASRNQRLIAQHSVSQRTFEQSVADHDAAQAGVEGAQAALDAAKANVEILNTQIDAAKATQAQMQALLDQAQLNLSYAQLSAPITGTVSQLSARVGNYATVGKTLLSIVPLEDLYIDANYRETQITNIAAGQKATFTVDAFPGQVFYGTVDSLGSSSGAAFSSVASQNVTGNFTKIAQRLPVRIAIDHDQVMANAMRVGMSVDLTIHTTHGAE